MTTAEETLRAVRSAEAGLLAAHSELIDDTRNAVEGLDRASCSAHITELARLAFGASAQGLSADEWRTWILDGLGQEHGRSVLAAAETCMRANGLWPWPS